MTDTSRLTLDAALGTRLVHADYRSDFARRDSEVVDRKSWKLERIQNFQELNDPSWDAFCRGELNESLRILEAEREGLLNEVKK